MELFIKYMVCPRCITSVEETFKELGIKIVHIQLGIVQIEFDLSKDQLRELDSRLQENGFELLSDRKSKVVSQIKSIIIDSIHHSNEILDESYSELLSSKLYQEYTSLSKLFSAVEGITIEKFILKQKIERVKELLTYDESSLSQIAFDMNYSSSAHLSTQFKKETGMTPSMFKKQRKLDRDSLDTI